MTKETFKDLMEQYERLVFTVCYRLVQNYHDAQNLTQDTFLAAYAHIDTVSEQNLSAWLTRIAANKSKDYLKSAYHRRVSPTEKMSELDILRCENSPERLYLSCEGQEEIRQMILNLKEPYHKVCILFFLQEKSIDEIAAVLDRPKKTVQTQLYRARSMLQDRLKEDCG